MGPMAEWPGWWARGLRLDERLGAIMPAPPSTMDERTERRVQRWRDAYQVAPGELDRIGPTEATLAALLAEQPDALAARCARPQWADLVEEILAAAPDRPPVPGLDGQAWGAGFVTIVRPFWQHGATTTTTTVLTTTSTGPCTITVTTIGTTITAAP